jgi:hypothetical protein
MTAAVDFTTNLAAFLVETTSALHLLMCCILLLPVHAPGMM